MRTIRRVAALTGAVLVGMVLSATPALAVAGPEASCNGLGGSHEAVFGGPGARADIAHEFGGAEFSFWAKQHLGSVDACFGG